MVKNKKYSLSFIKQAGFSLIELMIAIPLGLLVTYTVAAIYLDSIKGAYLQNDFSRVQESGRMAIEIISRDIRGADFWGCLRDTSLIVNNLTVAANTVSTTGVAGQENITAGITRGGINVAENTDTLTLAGTNSFPNTTLTVPTLATGNLTITAGSGIATNDNLIISDCEKADLFSNTAANTNTTGVISHAVGVRNTTANLSGIYENGAQILRPYVKTYFVGVDAGVSSLYRQDNGGVPIELVRGITDLQLTYQDNSLSVGQFSVATAVNMDEVRVINVNVESQSNNATITKDYRVSVNIRNRTLQ